MDLCEFCSTPDAVHHHPHDYQLCERCFRHRRTVRLLATAIGAAFLVALVQTCHALSL